jgi:hypothetical protein
MYAHLCEGDAGGSNKKIWKAKIPRICMLINVRGMLGVQIKNL